MMALLNVMKTLITETTHPIEGRHFIFLFYYFFLSCDLHVPVDLVL